MLCVPSVIILANILESILWCYLVSSHSIPGFEPETHPTYLMLIVFARSFRILVTFALVLEVRGISFFQILWTSYGRSLLDQKITIRVLLTSSRFYVVTLSVLPSLHGLSGRNLLNLVRHTNLCIHNSESYMFLWVVPLFSCILISVYHLIVKSMYAMHSCSSIPITLVVRQAILFQND